jgi:hypothetical protein
MKRIRFGFPIGHPGLAEMLRGSSILITILMAIVFFASCETTKKDQADANTVIREPDKGHEVHGEVGAMYGSSLGRH